MLSELGNHNDTAIFGTLCSIWSQKWKFIGATVNLGDALFTRSRSLVSNVTLGVLPPMFSLDAYVRTCVQLTGFPSFLVWIRSIVQSNSIPVHWDIDFYYLYHITSKLCTHSWVSLWWRFATNDHSLTVVKHSNVWPGVWPQSTSCKLE